MSTVCRAAGSQSPPLAHPAPSTPKPPPRNVE